MLLANETVIPESLFWFFLAVIFCAMVIEMHGLIALLWRWLVEAWSNAWRPSYKPRDPFRGTRQKDRFNSRNP